MRKQMMAVMDSEPDYAMRFMNYANRRSDTPFRVCAFTRWQDFQDFISSHRVSALLISERDAETYHTDLEQLKGRIRVVILAEEATGARGKDPPSIWRYQPASTIITGVMILSGMTAPDIEPEGLLKGRTQFIGVFSPVGRIGKTLFARELAARLKISRSTLFLNFEAFPFLEEPEDPSGTMILPGTPGAAETNSADVFSSATSGIIPGQKESPQNFAGGAGDLSDLLYFLLGEEPNLNARFLSLIREEGGISWIPPSRHPAELLKLSEENWSRLFQMIRRESPYETVVLDLGLLPTAAPWILEECDILYMPYLGDHCSMRKTALAEDNILDYSADLSGSIRKVDFSEAVHSGPYGSGSMRVRISELAEDCIRRDRL